MEVNRKGTNLVRKQNVQVFNNSNLGIKVRTIKNEDGSIAINAEDTAKGLGWSKIERKNGQTYLSIRWERMNKYSKEFGFDHKWAKDDYIPESLFYLFAMKSDAPIAIDFQKWLATEVIPQIRKTGSYQIEKPKSALDLFESQLLALKEIEGEVKEVKSDLEEFKEDIPLFNIECDELQALVKKKGVKILGGKGSLAYKDNSLRTKVYIDIQHQIKREFGLSSYKAIKRKQLNIAKDLIDEYKVPTYLLEQIENINNQMKYEI